MQIIALAIFVFIFAVVYVAVHFLIKKKHWVLKGLISFIGTITIIGLMIYGFSPKKIVYSDPELAPLWKAVEEVKRVELGFTPVLKDSEIRIERTNGRAYDVMLHIYHLTSRTIAFKKKGDGFIWIGDQDGLQRYDGYKFTIFKAKLGSGKITAIEDKSSNLWIISESRLHKFNPITEKFKCFENNVFIRVW